MLTVQIASILVDDFVICMHVCSAYTHDMSYLFVWNHDGLPWPRSRLEQSVTPFGPQAENRSQFSMLQIIVHSQSNICWVCFVVRFCVFCRLWCCCRRCFFLTTIIQPLWNWNFTTTNSTIVITDWIVHEWVCDYWWMKLNVATWCWSLCVFAYVCRGLPFAHVHCSQIIEPPNIIKERHKTHSLLRQSKMKCELQEVNALIIKQSLSLSPSLLSLFSFCLSLANSIFIGIEWCVWANCKTTFFYVIVYGYFCLL